jgi:predicted nucleic acid-binding protein
MELLANGAIVVIPEIADYELRREFTLVGMTESIKQLDGLKSVLRYDPITTDAMLLAADFWAQARRQGRKTADDKALDGDVILAAQASLLTHLGDEVVVATTNVKHLSLFVDARLWQDVPVQEES